MEESMNHPEIQHEHNTLKKGLLFQRWAALLLAFIFLLLFHTISFGAAEDEPQTFLYGVTFTNDDGNPLELNRKLHSVNFRLWPELIGGINPDYEETFLDIDVVNGFIELRIGINGFPAGGLPDLTISRFAEISVRVDPTDPLTTFTPRTELPSVPLARNARRATFLGGFTASALLNLINDGDHARYTDSEAVAAAIADDSIIKRNQAAEILADLTLSTSAIIAVSSFGSSATTRVVIRNQGSDLILMDSLGNLRAQTFHGDGSVLANVVHLEDTQTISGTKTFNASETHFIFMVNAGGFSGDGSLITSVVHTFGDEIIDGEKNFEKDLVLHSSARFLSPTASIHFQPSSAPLQVLTRFSVLDSGGIEVFSIHSDGDLEAKDVTANQFFGDGTSLTNLVILTDYLQEQVVTTSKIRDDAVTSGKIFDSTISSPDIGDHVVLNSHIASGAITSGKISGSITLPADLELEGYLSRDINNTAFGVNRPTHVNLGALSITGIQGLDQSYVSIGGGFSNTAEGNFSVISGGRNNRASGNYSVIPGGRMLELLGDSSIGFNATSAQVSVMESQVAILMGVRKGLNTTNPRSVLDILPLSSYPLMTIRTGDLEEEEVLRVTSSGLIGIRTANPAYELEINGTLKLKEIILGSDSRTAFGVTSGAFSIDTVNLQQVASYIGGPVSIGTTVPNALFTVAGSMARDASNPMLGIESDTHVNLGIASTTGSTTDLSEHISIGGGLNHTAAMSFAVISGGEGNQALATAAAILGGSGNLVEGSYASVGGGQYNAALGDYSSVGGGRLNTAQAQGSRIGGGERNWAVDMGSSVASGLLNTASGEYAAISGGKGNQTSGNSVWIGGGDSNLAIGDHSLVGGGASNSSLASGAVILGGSGNLAAMEYSAIVGGFSNTSTAPFAFSGGGSTNTVSGWYAVIGGGRENTASGTNSAISGGQGNTASTTGSFVGAGSSNQALGIYTVVGGGESNLVQDDYSSILGGSNNQVLGKSSTIAGGGFLTLQGDHSFGFSALSTAQVVNLSSAAVFLGVSMGINTTNPMVALHVEGSLIADNLTGSGNLSYDGSLSADQSNQLLGNNSSTHVNLGQSSTTGKTSADSSFVSIGGGFSNTAADDFSVIGGGSTNIALGAGSVIAGGVDNQSNDDYTVISGGNANTGIGSFAFLGGGQSNIVSGTYSSLVGGLINTATADYAFIGGGRKNRIESDQSGDGHYAFIGGGDTNKAKDSSYGVIGGGQVNTLEGSHSTIAGGNNNSTFGDKTTVSGGESNTAASQFATIAGGSSNQAQTNLASYSAIGGGSSNIAGSSYTVISGGLNNQAMGALSSVGGGSYNTASGNYAVISGGTQNSASTSSTIGGGDQNLALGSYGVISGGQGNFTTGVYSTISGGQGNYLTASFSSISGGEINSSSASWAVIGGGKNNEILGHYGVIGGGEDNTVSSTHGNISGGEGNNSSGSWSTIAGGENNSVTGVHSAVLGGEGNTVSGAHSAILGGRNLTLSGDGAFGLNGSAATHIITDSSVFAMMGVKAGIQSTSPQGWLEVIGDGSAPTLRVLTTQGATSILIVSSTGNVGINTDGPTELFEVNGTLKAQDFVGRATNLVFSNDQVFASINASGSLTVSGSISKGTANQLLGSNASTQINLGSNSITGTSGGLGAYASVLGGRYQTAVGDYVLVAGGKNNQASGEDSVVIGGLNNTATGDQSGVFAGENNTVQGVHSAILGGQNLTISGSNSIGFNADSSSQTISNNKVVAFLGGVQVGINENSPSEALDVSGNIKATSFIGDASSLTFPTNMSFGSVETSGNLTISGYISKDPANTVGSSTQVNLGSGSETTGNYSTVGGGDNNKANQSYATTAGGQNNTASGTYAVVSGGRDNTASASDSAVAGGKSNAVSGNRSTILGGQNLTISGNDSLGFSGSGSAQLVQGDNVAVFLSVNMGIGTTNPQSALQVSQGGLCVETAGACSGKNSAGTIYADNTTVQQADYAEYFPSEEPMESGDIVGLNRVSGKVRKYQIGDPLVGVISTKPGIIGGANRDPRTHALVAILGQVPVNDQQTRSSGVWITTIDGNPIGLSLSNEQVYLTVGQGKIESLQGRIQSLETDLEVQRIRAEVQQKRYEALAEEIRLRLNEIERQISR